LQGKETVVKTLLVELINKKLETPNLDYKEGFAWTKKNRAHQFELIKDILAMANTRDGGTIILGVKDNTREFVGVSKEVWDSFDQSSLAKMVHRYSTPKVSLQVIKSELNVRPPRKLDR
jgi:predicted HTH transcriptional regulator